MSIVIVQPWFAAIGHPAQSLINLANIIGNDGSVYYLISMIRNSSLLDGARDRIGLLGNLNQYQVKTPSIREGTLKALLALRRLLLSTPLIDNIFFLDAHLVLLAAFWPFFYRKRIKRLGLVYLLGPEKVTRHMLLKLIIARFLKRKEVVLFLRTDELVTAWKSCYPEAVIKCLPCLEMPFDNEQIALDVPSSDEISLGVLGQIRSGKSLEWLVPFFSKNNNIAKLTVAGAFSHPDDRIKFANLFDFNGFTEKYLSESELIHIASKQDYLLMLYDDWDHRMEGAVMYLAARVNKPVIVYNKGWCGRMVKTFGNGLFAPDALDEFDRFVTNLPHRGGKKYEALLKGVLAFRLAHSGTSSRDAFLDVLQG